MGKDGQKAPDPRVVEKLLDLIWHDAELEAQKDVIDEQTAELSAQWAEADERGDINLCEEIERRMRELDRARQEIG